MNQVTVTDFVKICAIFANYLRYQVLLPLIFIARPDNDPRIVHYFFLFF